MDKVQELRDKIKKLEFVDEELSESLLREFFQEEAELKGRILKSFYTQIDPGGNKISLHAEYIWNSPANKHVAIDMETEMENGQLRADPIVDTKKIDSQEMREIIEAEYGPQPMLVPIIKQVLENVLSGVKVTRLTIVENRLWVSLSTQ